MKRPREKQCPAILVNKGSQGIEKGCELNKRKNNIYSRF
jgi:hypothetical protein